MICPRAKDRIWRSIKVSSPHLGSSKLSGHCMPVGLMYDFLDMSSYFNVHQVSSRAMPEDWPGGLDRPRFPTPYCDFGISPDELMRNIYRQIHMGTLLLSRDELMRNIHIGALLSSDGLMRNIYRQI